MVLLERKSGGLATFAALIVILAALVLRFLSWPARYEVRDVDEVGYISSSLVLVEGITPGYKPAPGGPQIWLGWACAQMKTAWGTVFPDAMVGKLPLQLRPFVAMNESLFFFYRDMSGLRRAILVLNVLLLVLAVVAGFNYGTRCGSTMGGVMAGGLLALSPIFVDYSTMARPYSMAWSFGVLSIWAAAAMRSKWRILSAGVLLGLAIGSRIEMVLITPLLIWEIWDAPPREISLRTSFIQLIATSLLTAYIVAPWLLTGLPGNLRAIGTVQVANPRAAAITLQSILIDFAWNQGFGLPTVLLFAGIPLIFAGTARTHRVVLILFVLLLLTTIFKTTGFGLHHNGPALVALVLGCARAMSALAGRWPRFGWAVVAAVLALPAVQSMRAIATLRGRTITPTADWIESHVPAGTVVYTTASVIKAPLPTAHAADVIWDDVANSRAWQRKFESGMKRFGLSLNQLPRAMSEENLVQERGNLRRWFILGSAGDDSTSRYDIRLIRPSPVFGIQDVAAAFLQSGGVVLWPEGDPPPSLGKPIAQFIGDRGNVTEVFCSPDVRLTKSPQ